MRTPIIFATVLLVAVLLSSCKTNEVALDYTNAKGEVQQLGNLVFRFDRSVSPDSLLNQWDSTEYIQFEPAIPGRFRWEAPDQLVFSPAKPLSPATSYKARLNDEIIEGSRYNKIEKAQIEFHTPALEINNMNASWVVDENSGMPVPQLALSFNYQVDPSRLKEKLTIQVNGKQAAYSIESLLASNKITLRLQAFNPEDKDYEAALKIEKGLVPDGGKNGTTEIINKSGTIFSPYILTVNEVESQHDGTEGIVHITTNQQLSQENISQFIKFEPSVAFRVEYTDAGIDLYSEKFDADKSYDLVISKGLRGKIGGTLRESYYGSVAFGELESDIRFTNSKGIFLSKKGSGNIEVRITNTPKVKLIISKIYPNNILMAQRNGYYPSDPAEEGEGYNEEYNSSEAAMAGDVIYTKVVDTRTLSKSGNARIINIADFEDRLPELKGIYHVLIRSTEDYWINDSRFISYSDIGLIAKEGKDQVQIFANSIKSAKGIEGISINLYGRNNQLLGTAATDAQGVAVISKGKGTFPGFQPAMITAQSASDFTYLPFNTTRVNTSRFDVGGKRLNNTGMDAYVYAERDIYRPGEKVNFAVIVRNAGWNTPGEIPIKIKFLLPNGKELKVLKKTLNEGGAVDGSIELSAETITGSYALEVYSSNDVLLSTKNIMVEEFIPDRIKVTSRLNKTAYHPSERADLYFNAVNFFGPPAANRNYEVEVQLKQKNFVSKNFRDYDFELANRTTPGEKQVYEGKTNDQGNGNQQFDIPSIYNNAGLLQLNFYTTVFDETGRPVSRLSSADVNTQQVYNGIMMDDYDYYRLNEPINFRLVSVNPEGIAVTAPTRVKVIKHEYRTVLAKAGRYFRYESQEEEKVIADNNIAVGNGTTYKYIPRSPGDYELRVYRPGANSYVARKFYSYGPWGIDNSSFEVNTEGTIDIETDKEKYKPGEVMKVLFKAPFSGRMLVTTEREGVLSYQYIDVSNRAATLELPVSNSFLPNVYITATLIKPHESSDIPLTVANGFKSIDVADAGRQLKVDIVAATSSRSQKQQRVRIKTAPNAFVSLAVVDNGVLQVTNFKTPDPFQYFYQRRALEVAGYNMYPFLFPEVNGRFSSTGGDGEAEMQKRVNPMPAKRVKIASYWSGIRKTNSSGIAEFDVDIPSFSGQLRMMAVAFKDQQFGAAEATMQVADPIVLSPSIPRFLSPGDTAIIPVTITNTTVKQTAGTVTIKTRGPLKIIGPASAKLSAQPSAENRIYFTVMGEPSIGIAGISLSVDALGERFNHETEISVRPPSTLQKLTGSGSITGGSGQKIEIPISNFIPSSADYNLFIGRSPLLEYGSNLKKLIQYPFGCTEQTISIAFPQLYFGDMTSFLSIAKTNAANANIVEAIRKLKMRQLYNGAVTLWDGWDKEDWWTTAYAAHFLIEARKTGFDVDNSLLETMLGYLISRLKTKETINYYYNRGATKKIAPKEVAYSLYVLAMANKPQPSAMNFYRSNSELLALDSKYLLAAAYALGGDKRAYAGFLPGSFSGEASVKQTGGSFYSEARDEALALNALLEVDPGNPQIPLMARHISQRLKSNSYLNTQEQVFSFLALGKLARSAANSTVAAEVKANGRSVGKIREGYFKANKQVLQSPFIEVNTSGSGRIFYSWESSGIDSKGDYKEEDNYIRVRRTYYDRYGRKIERNTFRQNELVIVAVSLEKAFAGKIENIVITDLLPAGFEIENPRTKEIPGMDWIKNQSEPKALDARDDRIHFFVDASADKQSYYYAVRAVSLGNFKQGPISADAMYNAEIHSYNGALSIRVIE